MDASSLALIGTGLVLIVTIVGWIVTYRLQKQILEMQINADKDTESRKLIIPHAIESLRAYKAWLEESPLIMDPIPPTNAEERRKSTLEWMSQIWKHQAVIKSQFDDVKDAGLIEMIQDYFSTMSNALEANQPMDSDSLGLKVSKISMRIDKVIEDIAHGRRH